MILYPDVLEESHREIDKVVGPNRMPEWKDRQDLPYTRAVVEETLRCK
jgi:cytochrome P450